jgi:hypothetical protein
VDLSAAEDAARSASGSFMLSGLSPGMFKQTFEQLSCAQQIDDKLSNNYGTLQRELSL